MLHCAVFVDVAVCFFKSFGIVALVQYLKDLTRFVEQQLADASDVDQLLTE